MVVRVVTTNYIEQTIEISHGAVACRLAGIGRGRCWAEVNGRFAGPIITLMGYRGLSGFSRDDLTYSIERWRAGLAEGGRTLRDFYDGMRDRENALGRCRKTRALAGRDRLDVALFPAHGVFQPRTLPSLLVDAHLPHYRAEKSGPQAVCRALTAQCRQQRLAPRGPRRGGQGRVRFIRAEQGDAASWSATAPLRDS